MSAPHKKGPPDCSSRNGPSSSRRCARRALTMRAGTHADALVRARRCARRRAHGARRCARRRARRSAPARTSMRPSERAGAHVDTLVGARRCARRRARRSAPARTSMRPSALASTHVDALVGARRCARRRPCRRARPTARSRFPRRITLRLSPPAATARARSETRSPATRGCRRCRTGTSSGSLPPPPAPARASRPSA